jgi:glycosyltransferase involved in cell wall biosynthesis
MSTYLHIIKTKSFANDSRLLKWIESLNNNNKSSSVFILQDDNIKKSFFVRDTRVTATSLWMRKFFKKNHGYIFKVPELTYKTLNYIRRDQSEILVFHDLQQYLTLFILCLIKPKNKKIIWDLHELFHESLIKFFVSRSVIRFILNKVDCIIYTNAYRRDYILKHLKNREKQFFILNNYTDSMYVNQKQQVCPVSLAKWLDGYQYIIWLGNGSINRNFHVFLNAYTKELQHYKLVILGKPDNAALEYIKSKNLEGKVYEAFVSPAEMLSFIDNAVFSVVLYKHSSPNNYYCEPNRLYQVTSRGIPVIVGNNPPMKDLVEKYKAGIILKDDGSNLELLIEAIKALNENITFFKENLRNKNIPKQLSWENQFSDFLTVLENIHNHC